MSKGLEALKEIKNYYNCMNDSQDDRDNFAIIEKELKSLEILKNKQVDIELFMECDTWEEYVLRCENHADMSKPVYDLLREVLDYDD